MEEINNSNMDTFPTINTPSVKTPTTKANRSRSSSVLKEKRQYSYSVSSVKSEDDEVNPYKNRNRKLSDIDLENQLIASAGGKKEYVYCFFLKLLILMSLVLGSGILIFYAL